MLSLATLPDFTPQLMTSASVYIRDRKNKLIKCRALLDTCATANFISETMVKRLNAHVVEHLLPVGAINEMNTVSRGMVKIIMRSIHDDFCKELTCLTIPNIAGLVPSEIFPRDSINLPSNIRLADPEFYLPRPVDLLVGSSATLSLLAVGQINITNNNQDIYIQKTRLGWVLAGRNSQAIISKSATCHLTNLENLLQKFWTMEEIPLIKSKSAEDDVCEAHFMQTVARDDTGRYIVRLPFRNANCRPGESRKSALKRLFLLEKRLNADARLKSDYDKILKEYLSLNHMSRVEDTNNLGYYMPHHAVVKETSATTKVRIVFDASAKSDNGTSLNETLLTGPTIQDNLISHLIRFRVYKYVITADIEKMFRQVWLHEDDRRYQRLLWRENGEIQTYQINTLVFGISSSPFLAIRTIQKLADDEGLTFPRAAKILKSHLYVDDLLSGAESINEARAMRQEITTLLAKGGFSIRQWASNDRRIIDDLENEALHTNFILNGNHTLKTLGMSWSAQDDKLYYIPHPINIQGNVSKRNVLSEIAKIFDPLGLLGPIILRVKKLMQDIW